MSHAHGSERVEPAGRAIPSLPDIKGPRGIDAYCHVCWEPVYRLWVDPEPPDYDVCAIGPYSAQTCPNAVAGAHSAKRQAAVDDRALELWREREMVFPERVRRMKPDDMDRASGAWAIIRNKAQLEVLARTFRRPDQSAGAASDAAPAEREGSREEPLPPAPGEGGEL